MSVYRVNDTNSASEKIRLLNEMILEVNGGVSNAKFDVNELTQLFTDLGYDRKFLRNQSLGNSISTYTGWTHLKAESGYSIWSYTPTNYVYNSLNQLYLDSKVLDNRGQATSESATVFNKVFFYNGDSGTGYTDVTAEAGTEEGTEFELMDSTTDYLYIGDTSTFGGIKFEFQTKGSNYTNTVQYWSGSAWTTLTALTNNYDDDTSNFESDGDITWDIPGDWDTTTVNSSSQYWIRIVTSTDPVTEAKAYYIIPNASVIGLLAMSSSEIQNENWAWCSYSSSIYVAIRNSGNSTYEGEYFITSSSSTANLQNFFIYNHAFTADYEDSTYVATSSSLLSGVITGDKTINNAVANDVVYVDSDDTFDQAQAIGESKVGIGVYDGTNIYLIGNKNINTVGSGDITAGDKVYLSITAGKVTKTPPSGSGQIIQYIGRAKSAESTSLVNVILDIDTNPILMGGL